VSPTCSPPVANVFGFKACATSVWKTSASPNGFHHRLPRGPADASASSAIPDEQYGRPLAGLQRSSRRSSSPARNTAGWSYECLRGGLDFTKDDERTSNSQPFQRLQNRFEFVLKPSNPAQQETGEKKRGNYLNWATAAHSEGGVERAEFAKETRSRSSCNDYINRRLFQLHTGLSKVCRTDGMLLQHSTVPMHALIDRTPSTASTSVPGQVPMRLSGVTSCTRHRGGKL